jgi:hydroxymethylglutaryl-CoA synthase
MMEESGTKASDYTYAVFHQPNVKFPQRLAKELGFSDDQIKTGLLSPVIGNTYAGASPLGLTAILDIAKAGDRILMVSYGSGAGSDALDLQVTESIEGRQKLALTTADYIARRVEINYATYTRYRGILAMK